MFQLLSNILGFNISKQKLKNIPFLGIFHAILASSIKTAKMDEHQLGFDTMRIIN